MDADRGCLRDEKGCTLKFTWRGSKQSLEPITDDAGCKDENEATLGTRRSLSSTALHSTQGLSPIVHGWMQIVDDGGMKG